jgi:hypothetical protein
LTVDGSLTLGSQATTAVELGGEVAGVEHDQVVVTGTGNDGFANLDGTLAVTNLAGFAPAGQSFDIITCESGCNNDFSTFNEPGGYTLDSSAANLVTLVHDAVTEFFFDNEPGNFLWSEAENWSFNALPTAGDSVILDGRAGGPVLLTQGVQSVGNVSATVELVINGGSLDIAQLGDFGTDLTLRSGALRGAGTVQVAGVFNWSGGTVSVAQLDANGGVNIGGPNTKTLSGSVLNNSGPGTWSGTGDVVALAGAAFNNLGPGNFDTRANASWSSADGAEVSNAGLFTKSTGNTARFGPNVAFMNTGTVRVQAGTMVADNYTQTAGRTEITGGTLTGNINILGGTFDDGSPASGDMSPQPRTTSGDPNAFLFGDLGGTLANDPVEEVVIVQTVSAASTDAVVTVQAQPLFPESQASGGSQSAVSGGSNAGESSDGGSTPGGEFREAVASEEGGESVTLVCQ